MEPYYSHDGCTIYNADVREILPHISDIHAVVTDPPYGLNYNDQNDLTSRWEFAFGGRKESQGENGIEGDGEHEAHELFESMLATLEGGGLVKGAAVCCCCCGGGPKPIFAKWALMIDQIIGFKHAVVWDKGGMGMGIHFRRNYEFVLIGQNGAPAHKWNGGKTTTNVWQIPKIIPQAWQHPTAKPVALMAKCIALFTDPGELVVDPFMGQGPTVVAAKQLRRRCIGIEINESYCERAAQRLQQDVMDI